MAYTKTTWNPGGPPGISAEKLNNIENGIEAAHKMVETDIRTPDQTQAAQPSGTLLQLQNFWANILKRITGKTNWYDTPDLTLADLKTHKSRHATGGADALTPADIGAAPSSHTHTRSQITDFAHKATHASGGSDALSPSDIGAVTTSSFNSHVSSGVHIGNNPACRVYHSEFQSVPSGSDTVLVFDSERFDNDNMHDSTNPSRLTCRTAGVYLITGHVVWSQPNANDAYEIFIRLNGATKIASIKHQTTTIYSFIHHSIVTIYKLNAGDYVELVVKQSTGSSRLIYAYGNYSPEFAMARIG